MKQMLFGGTPVLKVNMHCHTTVSDGKQTPEEIKEHYKALGYDAVAFTDHNVLFDHKELNDDRFTAIAGYEVNITDNTSQVHLPGVNPAHWRFYETVHLNLYPKDQEDMTTLAYAPVYLFKKQLLEKIDERVKFAGDGNYKRVMTAEAINALIAEAKEHGQLVSFNHPRWSMNTSALYTKLEGLFGFEIANGDCIRNSDMDYQPLVYEQMMRAGHRMAAIGGDDNHDLPGMHHAWTMVASEDRSATAILAAIERGDCYASCGPDFTAIWVEDNAVHVRTSPVDGIYLTTAGRRTAHAAVAEKKPLGGVPYLTEAVFPLSADDICFRLQLRDARGKRASSRFYYFDELSPDVLHFEP